MAMFTCAACGGHAFKLSADLTQTHCGDCRLPLGSWQSLRAEIKQKLHHFASDRAEDVKSTGTVVTFKPRAA